MFCYLNQLNRPKYQLELHTEILLVFCFKWCVFATLVAIYSFLKLLYYDHFWGHNVRIFREFSEKVLPNKTEKSKFSLCMYIANHKLCSFSKSLNLKNPIPCVYRSKTPKTKERTPFQKKSFVHYDNFLLRFSFKNIIVNSDNYSWEEAELWILIILTLFQLALNFRFLMSILIIQFLNQSPDFDPLHFQ